MRMLEPIAVAAVAVGLLVSGCTTDTAPADTSTEESTAMETATPSPSPTPSPTLDVTVPPKRPEAMATPSADGAAAAASYFISLYVYMYATGDTSTWRQMSAPTCAFCLDAAADAEAVAASGRRGGTPVEIKSAEGLELKPGEWFTARLRVIQPPTIEVDTSGNETQTSDGGTYDFDFAMTWNGDWTIDSIGVEPVVSE
ncbi:DUF6318 family protein [Cellulomonas dongxiuzhuiae]|uniref:DUF6318 domain-containing protein n=1 Tax=Cellulomonas dongxiuzhuiae TaxID=2819979 RepID=A0ABX8GFS9_9CELL|nr:DUF6318 family protein [Cellulomonas dongxiuzhuiae]MBO3093612.1 hypothetical protein [Cellulomonas dongxiuzhuiae]QWC14732.1 hypothetical protein KKR89_10135 [Cellulomonas dongxiuzhuiae]